MFYVKKFIFVIGCIVLFLIGLYFTMPSIGFNTGIKFYISGECKEHEPNDDIYYCTGLNIHHYLLEGYIK